MLAWAWTTLRADTASGGVNTLVGGRIYRDLVPQQAALPAVVLSTQSAVDGTAIGGRRVVTTIVLNVRVVGEGATYATVQPIADRVDTVLNNATGTQSTVTIGKLVRESVEQFLEVSDGVTYADIVQLYRTTAYAA